MVGMEDLAKIYMMQNLTESMREKVASISELRVYEEKEAILEQGQPAEDFMMLRSGKVLLKIDASEAMTISLGSIKAGFSFGWSSLIPGGRHYSASAVCAEKCEVLAVKADLFTEMMDQDPRLGYAVFRGVAEILESRLQRRTGQFLKTLLRHINLEAIL